MKLYAVIVLAMIAAVMAYVRFGRKPAAAARPPPPPAAARAAAFEIPVLPPWVLGSSGLSSHDAAPYEAPLRDLFAPAADPPASEPVSEAATQPAAEPSGGTPPRAASGEGLPVLTAIMKGRHGSLAIIDGNVVGAGERVGDYTVLEVGEGHAIVSRGGRRMRLTILE